MPKDESYSHKTSHRSRTSPYSHSSKHSDHCGPKNTLPSLGDEREWEEARCSICMEHPHNAVLLHCSSHEKGCRPYMCDTSHRHSNCLKQFRKSSPLFQTISLREDMSRWNKHGLSCPLCRGEVIEWVVVEPARSFMNLKSRSCSLENCDFSGTYQELRAHARREHPSGCPTEANSTRQEEWTRLENETFYQDLLGVSTFGDELSSLDDCLLEDDFVSFFENLDFDYDMMETNFELELPFTFLESPVFHTSAHHSLEWSYRPRNREFNHPTSQSDNRTRGHSSRRSNSH